MRANAHGAQDGNGVRKLDGQPRRGCRGFWHLVHNEISPDHAVVHLKTFRRRRERAGPPRQTGFSEAQPNFG